MFIFLKVVLYTLYDLFRYNVNLLVKKKDNQNYFKKLNKINNKILNKKELNKKKILVASFVHQYGYIYTECLIANHLLNRYKLGNCGKTCNIWAWWWWWQGFRYWGAGFVIGGMAFPR